MQLPPLLLLLEQLTPTCEAKSHLLDKDGESFKFGSISRVGLELKFDLKDLGSYLSSQLTRQMPN